VTTVPQSRGHQVTHIPEGEACLPLKLGRRDLGALPSRSQKPGPEASSSSQLNFNGDVAVSASEKSEPLADWSAAKKAAARFEQVSFLLGPYVLSSEPPQLLALLGRQTVRADSR
jgi:hypothetical protein